MSSLPESNGNIRIVASLMWHEDANNENCLPKDTNKDTAKDQQDTHGTSQKIITYRLSSPTEVARWWVG